MPDFSVVRHGTDPNGRPIYMTVYMRDWWAAYCAALGFTPTIVQGAHMKRAGGGASASAGYHDLAGCLDLRVWDKTPEQQRAMIRKARARGAAAWLRDERHGMDPHIHMLLGTDRPLASGAQTQWQQYLKGRDGLAGNGPDYHWRPDPLVTTPPEVSVPTCHNGWPVITSARYDGAHPRLRRWTIAPTKQVVPLRDGSAGFILVHLASWFHENVERIDTGVFDDWGYAYRAIRGGTKYSNHAGGVAIDINATQHPLGVAIGSTFSAAEQKKIRDHLKTYGGAITWGGDYNGRPDGMHFEWSVGSTIDQAERLAAKLMATDRGRAILAANPGAEAVIRDGNQYIEEPEPELTPALRVATVNAYGRNKRQAVGIARLIAEVRETDGHWLDVIGVQEAKELLEHDTVIAHHDGDRATYDVVGARDYGLAVLVKRGRNIRKGKPRIMAGARAVGSGKNNHERGTLLLPVSKRGEKATVIVSHLHVVDEVALATKPPKNWPEPGTLHQIHAAAITGLAVSERAKGRKPIVLADANAGIKSQWSGSLANQLEAAGFVVTGHKIDLVAAHPEDLDLESQRVLDPKVVGSDKHGPVVVGWRSVG